MDPLFQEHVLNSPAVCTNCFRVVREERSQLFPSNQYNDAELHDLGDDRAVVEGDNRRLVMEATYGRSKRRTDVEYVPSDRPTDSKTIFCQCGVTGSYSREWADDDLATDRARLKELLRNLAVTLAELEIDHERRRLLEYGLTNWRRLAVSDAAITHHDPVESANALFGEAVRAAVVAAGVRDTRSRRRQPSD